MKTEQSHSRCGGLEKIVIPAASVVSNELVFRPKLNLQPSCPQSVENCELPDVDNFFTTIAPVIRFQIRSEQVACRMFSGDVIGAWHYWSKTKK